MAVRIVDLLVREKVELSRELLKKVAKVEELVRKLHKALEKFQTSNVRSKAKKEKHPTHEIDVAVSVNRATTVKLSLAGRVAG